MMMSFAANLWRRSKVTDAGSLSIKDLAPNDIINSRWQRSIFGKFFPQFYAADGIGDMSLVVRYVNTEGTFLFMFCKSSLGGAVIRH